MVKSKRHTSQKVPGISIVVPVYKEELTIRPFLKRAEHVLAAMHITYEIIFCLDPSPDYTEQVILEEIDRNTKIKLIVLSRRFGQPTATMAGILLCKGKACAVIDVDLQDPPEPIDHRRFLLFSFIKSKKGSSDL
jgi:dolichol-phosphate mannosyltransferase